jgi:glycosyltransferase involved in cell wall biosynthesis
MFYDLDKRLIEFMPECDVNVATFSLTVYPTYISGKGKPYYLVQHYEPDFFNEKELKLRSEGSYCLPLQKLCVSHWLTKKMGGKYIGNGINLTKFKPMPEENREPRSVLLFIREGIEWKNPEFNHELAEALRRCNFKAYEAKGNLTEQELLDCYGKVQVLIYLSKGKEGFGYPPLEAMACGVPVITSPCLEYARHRLNAFVLPDSFSVEDILDRLVFILKDDSIRNKLVQGGFKTAKKYDFEKVVDRFEKIISSS